MERDYDVLKVELDKIADIGLDNYLMFEYSDFGGEQAGLSKSERKLLDRSRCDLVAVEALRQEIEDEVEALDDLDDFSVGPGDSLDIDDDDDDDCGCCYCRAQEADDDTCSDCGYDIDDCVCIGY